MATTTVEKPKTQTIVLQDQMGNEVHRFEMRADRNPRQVYWLPDDRCFLRDKKNVYKEVSGGPAASRRNKKVAMSLSLPQEQSAERSLQGPSPAQPLIACVKQGTIRTRTECSNLPPS